MHWIDAPHPIYIYTHIYDYLSSIKMVMYYQVRCMDFGRLSHIQTYRKKQFGFIELWSHLHGCIFCKSCLHENRLLVQRDLFVHFLLLYVIPLLNHSTIFSFLHCFLRHLITFKISYMGHVKIAVRRITVILQFTNITYTVKHTLLHVPFWRKK